MLNGRGEARRSRADGGSSNPASTPSTYEEWKRKQSQLIYQLRIQTGLTQKEFAVLVGWSPSQQSQIEQCAEAVRIRPMHFMAARFVADRPLEALKAAYDLSEDVREKVKAYAKRVQDLGLI